MELVIKENTFYILLNKQGEISQLSIFDALSPSVQKLKELMEGGITSEELELMSVQYEEEQFKIKSIPWNVIAMELVKE